MSDLPLPDGFSGMGFVDTAFGTLLEKFNVWNLPDYDNVPEPFIGHIFMSRPSLEILPNLRDMKKLSVLHGVLTDEYGEQLALSLDRNASSKWLPIITSRAKNYPVEDIELQSVEKSSTFFGHTITYSKHNEEYKSGKTISIDFRNDRFNSIFKLMYIWMFYIHTVSRSSSYIKVNPDYEENGILDYCASLYYVVTRSDNSRIIYWDKLVGVRPKKLPVSMYNWDDAIKLVDTVSIDFEYSLRSNPMDPAILMDINMLNNRTETEASIVLHSYPFGNSAFVQPDRCGIAGIDNPRFATNVNIIAVGSGTSIEYYLKFSN